MRVINLFAGPGAGKSTTAAGLFFEMKCAGLKVELVTEYAKELVYACDYRTLDDQHAVVMEQYARQKRLIGFVDWCITDSPILLALVYAVPPHRHRINFSRKVWSLFDEFDNINVKVNRVKAYQSYGRTQTFDQVGPLDHQISALAAEDAKSLKLEVDGDREAPRKIMQVLGLE